MMSAQTKTNAPAKEKATAKQSSQTPVSNPNAGQRIYIDPVTKQIVQPTAEDAQALDNAGKKPVNKKLLAAPASAGITAAEPQEFVTEGGFFGVVVPEETMAYAVVTKTEDGKLKMGCVDGKKQAEAVANSKSAPAKTEVLDVQ
jgi:hypothetical protein